MNAGATNVQCVYQECVLGYSRKVYLMRIASISGIDDIIGVMHGFGLEVTD